MPFRNPLVAGAILIREAIQSANYALGSAGWSINQDGSAEFNNVVIRGAVIAGSLVAQNGAGDKVSVVPDAPSYISDTTSPGILFERAGETGDGASITEYDDTFTRGLLLLSPSPVHGGSGGEDFAYMQLDGLFATDPSIQLHASGPDSFVSINGTIFDADGVITGYGGGAFGSYTPAVTGGGAVTWSTRDGWYQRIGQMVFVRIYLSVNGAGSGGTAITVGLPTMPDRTGGRQSVPGCARDGGVVAGPVGGLVFSGGTNAVIDRVVNSAGNDVTGAMLTAGSIWTIEGWYRDL